MKAKKGILHYAVFLALVLSISASGCITQEPKISADKLVVTLGECSASTMMPGEILVYMHVTLENKTGFDLNGLQAAGAEVTQDGQVVGSFSPNFRIGYAKFENDPCYAEFKSSSGYALAKFDLKEGCKLQFDIRASILGTNINPNKPLRFRFKFANNDYFTDTYECTAPGIIEVQ